MKPPLTPEIAGLVPFAVAPRWSRPFLDFSPLGVPIEPAHIFDPLRRDSAPFLTRLERLDALTFGPEGMPMPRWLFFDGAEMPAGLFGFAKPMEQLSPRARALFQEGEHATGLCPFAMYIAVPMLEAGSFMGHNLASVNRSLPEEGLRGLASATKAVGIAFLRARRVYGATQWRSGALGVHSRFGALELVTAFTPAHSNPHTLTYRFDVTQARLRAAALGTLATRLRPTAPPGDRAGLTAERWLDADDEAAMRALHEEVRAGLRWAIAGPPRVRAERCHVPLIRLDAARRRSSGRGPRGQRPPARR